MRSFLSLLFLLRWCPEEHGGGTIRKQTSSSTPHIGPGLQGAVYKEQLRGPEVLCGHEQQNKKGTCLEEAELGKLVPVTS